MKKEVRVSLATLVILLAIGNYFENQSATSLWTGVGTTVILGVYIYFQTGSFKNWLKTLEGLIVY